VKSAAVLLTGLLGVAAACQSNTQRLAGPLPLPEEPEYEHTDRVRAPRAVLHRHSDPVWLRPPGAPDDFPLPFYRKRERVAVGAGVRTGYGGRAELLWLDDASSMTLFDECHVVLGDPEIDEPLVRFLEVSRALLTLTPEDRIGLPGGAILRGDPIEPSGPFHLERWAPEYLRLTNQSKRPALISFREADLELAPGDSLEFPWLEDSSPRVTDPALLHLTAEGIEFDFLGKVERSNEAGGVVVRALSPSQVSSLGVEVGLGAGEEAVFSHLTREPERPSADPEEGP